MSEPTNPIDAPAPLVPLKLKHKLHVGELLVSNDPLHNRLVSVGGHFTAILQEDGNGQLVVKDSLNVQLYQSKNRTLPNVNHTH
ncbi:hypothetical protein DFA_08984 [Cavenderia fasciculata]|uniref:Uncharacterized protein n=1 Tax=Cavenderia fasciculata TaxID=261658 RepID=F4Q6D6_CACFS|nr:uncharacterized protein DFA_08984 [Cavenderia fasciculata]EGG16446.1 hypothetical protein DFA_08984 [Cavenderia fasciculata]|eukprot:XP_004354846.1 hypothetical protein DFA_08984 [Cavenderia fasciculata]